jgi:hypothetical protein
VRGLTASDVLDIRARRSRWTGRRLHPLEPDSLSSLAAEYDVSESLVSKIAHERIYAHVSDVPFGAGGVQ